MIELRMVRRMLRRGLVLAPLLGLVLWIFGGRAVAISAVIGLSLALANLWAAGRIIGGVAENNPNVLMGAAFAALMLPLLVLTAVVVALRQIDGINFTSLGITLVSAHLVLVGSEAARYFLKIPAEATIDTVRPSGVRS